MKTVFLKTNKELLDSHPPLTIILYKEGKPVKQLTSLAYKGDSVVEVVIRGRDIAYTFSLQKKNNSVVKDGEFKGYNLLAGYPSPPVAYIEFLGRMSEICESFKTNFYLAEDKSILALEFFNFVSLKQSFDAIRESFVNYSEKLGFRITRKEAIEYFDREYAAYLRSFYKFGQRPTLEESPTMAPEAGMLEDNLIERAFAVSLDALLAAYGLTPEDKGAILDNVFHKSKYSKLNLTSHTGTYKVNKLFHVTLNVVAAQGLGTYAENMKNDIMKGVDRWLNEFKDITPDEEGVE